MNHITWARNRPKIISEDMMVEFYGIQMKPVRDYPNLTRPVKYPEDECVRTFYQFLFNF